MTPKTVPVVALAVGLMAGIGHAQVFVGTTITFDKVNFEHSLTAAVAGNVKGYQFVLTKDGQVVSAKADGHAQNAADTGGAPLVMTTYTPTNIGSLAKFLSGTALLHLMVKPAGPGGSWDAGDTLAQKLNRRFITMIPDVWKSVIAQGGNLPGIEDITLRQLLQHRSGFDDSKLSNRTVLGFLGDADGFDPTQYGDREYSNINFVLAGYLMTMYEYPGAEDYYNLVTANLNQADADQLVRDHAGMSMHYIMKDRIWDQMNPTILPNCDAKNDLAGTAARAYDSKNDNSIGFIWSEEETFGHRKGQGGYYISSRALANYLAHFSASNLIVTNQARNLMYSDTMANANDRLVWSSASVDGWIADKFNMPRIVSSDGAQDNYRNVIVRLPHNYYLVLLTNSPELSTGQLKNAGVAAFRAGMEHNF
jgi:CubicO group peptidase (beta-lactamase class C family)